MGYPLLDTSRENLFDKVEVAIVLGEKVIVILECFKFRETKLNFNKMIF